MIDKTEKLPVTRQCEILNLCRSGIYYCPVPTSAKDLELMRQIDEIHLEYPFYGSRKIRNELWARGNETGRDKVRRLMRRIGIEALYVKPRLSLAHPAHVKYPYLLRNLEITRANQVWSSDITYIPMAKGFCFVAKIGSVIAGTPQRVQMVQKMGLPVVSRPSGAGPGAAGVIRRLSSNPDPREVYPSLQR
jgi:putative transposase